MAVALLGYFTTMVTAFVGLMLLLNNILSSSYLQPVHRPYPTPMVTAVAVPDKEFADGVKTASVEAPKTPTTDVPKPVVAEKSRRAKVAVRSQNRKEDLAGRQQDREYSLALGYAEQNGRQPSGLFDVFGTRRF